MHRALEVDEIVQAIVAGVGDPSDPVSRTALARLATTNRTFSMAALDTLWRTLSDQMLFALIQTIPPDYWTWRLTPDAESEYYKYAHRTLFADVTIDNLPDDWKGDRFKLYARRVRSIKWEGNGQAHMHSNSPGTNHDRLSQHLIDHSMFLALANTSTSQPIFPQLQHVSFIVRYEHDATILFACRLINPRLKSIILRYDEEKVIFNNPLNSGLAQIFSSIRAHSPLLQVFSFYWYGLTPLSQEVLAELGLTLSAISQNLHSISLTLYLMSEAVPTTWEELNLIVPLSPALVASWANLRTIQLMEHAIPDLVSILSTLPHLREASLVMSPDASPIIFRQDIVFPALENVEITVPDLVYLADVLGAVTTPILSRIHCTLIHAQTPNQVIHFFRKMEQTSFKRSLEIVYMLEEKEEDPELREYFTQQDFSQILEPLAELIQLQELHILCCHSTLEGEPMSAALSHLPSSMKELVFGNTFGVDLQAYLTIILRLSPNLCALRLGNLLEDARTVYPPVPPLETEHIIILINDDLPDMDDLPLLSIVGTLKRYFPRLSSVTGLDEGNRYFALDEINELI